jgi:hypothetical protein
MRIAWLGAGWFWAQLMFFESAICLSPIVWSPQPLLTPCRRAADEQRHAGSGVELSANVNSR